MKINNLLKSLKIRVWLYFNKPSPLPECSCRWNRMCMWHYDEKKKNLEKKIEQYERELKDLQQ